jgi:hypothetical protein
MSIDCDTPIKVRALDFITSNDLELLNDSSVKENGMKEGVVWSEGEEEVLNEKEVNNNQVKKRRKIMKFDKSFGSKPKSGKPPQSSLPESKKPGKAAKPLKSSTKANKPTQSALKEKNNVHFQLDDPYAGPMTRNRARLMNTS